MERCISFQIGGSGEDPSLRSWMKNKQTSTSKATDESLIQEMIRNNSVRRGDAQLHLAARIGNQAQLKDILKNFQKSCLKGSIWKKNSDGDTALFIAAANGHAEIVREILKAAGRQAAPANAENSSDAFHIAAKLGHAGKLWLLSLLQFVYLSPKSDSILQLTVFEMDYLAQELLSHLFGDF